MWRDQRCDRLARWRSVASSLTIGIRSGRSSGTSSPRVRPTRTRGPYAGAGEELWTPGRRATTVVAVDGDTVLGAATAGPDRPGRGSHVATASFMVSPAAVDAVSGGRSRRTSFGGPRGRASGPCSSTPWSRRTSRPWPWGVARIRDRRHRARGVRLAGPWPGWAARDAPQLLVATPTVCHVPCGERELTRVAAVPNYSQHRRDDLCALRLRTRERPVERGVHDETSNNGPVDGGARTGGSGADDRIRCGQRHAWQGLERLDPGVLRGRLLRQHAPAELHWARARRDASTSIGATVDSARSSSTIWQAHTGLT